MHVLRDCWVHGVVDENTLVWGQGLCDWLPIRNVRTLVPQIRTLEGSVCIPHPSFLLAPRCFMRCQILETFYSLLVCHKGVDTAMCLRSG